MVWRFSLRFSTNEPSEDLVSSIYQGSLDVLPSFFKPQGHFNSDKSFYMSVFSLLEVSDVD